jgi:hypothetical protein
MNFQWKRAAEPASCFERDVHHACLSCGDVITHPLCHECISDGFWDWLSGYKKFPRSILEKLQNFHEAHEDPMLIHPKCVSCNKAQVSVCPHCFTGYLYKMVKEAGVGVRVMSEFLFMFNFDFEHKGYCRDLEALGGY